MPGAPAEAARATRASAQQRNARMTANKRAGKHVQAKRAKFTEKEAGEHVAAEGRALNDAAEDVAAEALNNYAKNVAAEALRAAEHALNHVGPPSIALVSMINCEKHEPWLYPSMMFTQVGYYTVYLSESPSMLDECPHIYIIVSNAICNET